LLVTLLAGAASVGALFAQAQKKPAIAYPKDFRKWTHVKSMVIFDPTQNKLYQGFEGLHNVYVNDIGWPSLERGKAYPDGSMFAFELFARRNSPGAVESGARKFLAVMKKNAKLYPETGGWGFEVFQGYQATGSLKDMKACFSCHERQKSKDYVFSDFAQ
jgi:hypothetical protein